VKSNEELQKDVQDAIKWEPLLNAAEIGVTVKNGVVTLTGIVDSFPKKSEAEGAAKSVAGVKAVVENIKVEFTDNSSKKDDIEIANEILHAFKWNWKIPSGKVKVTVEKGWVTLDGQLHWFYQKEAAKEAVKNLLGVIRGVWDNMTIKSETEDQIETHDIESALRRNWSVGDKVIKVEVSSHNVKLIGKVKSWYQKEDAGRIAWNAPGVWTVDNELTVESD
jgi:osmotically-inducible protein OsmY